MADAFRLALSLSFSGALVAVALFAICRLLGRRLSSAWRYYAWLLVLLRLVIPFAPQEANLANRLFHPPAPQVRHVQQAPQIQQQAIVLPDVAAAPLPQPPPQASEIDAGARNVDWASLWQYAWIAWLAVALALLTRAVTSYHGFTRFIRAGWHPVDDPAALDVLASLCEAHGIRNAPALYENPLASAPMLVGIRKPVIVLPALPGDAAMLRHILSHELVHRRRQDILYKWLVQLVCCLHWFNPIVYLMRREIHILCELSCDARVLAQQDAAARKQYGDTLLAVLNASGHYGDLVASTTMSEEGNTMKKRLQAIAQPHRRTRLTVLLSLLLTALLAVGSAFAGAYTSTETTPPTDGLPVATQPPITAAPTSTQAPVTPDPTDALTPGQRLDNFLDEMNTTIDKYSGILSEKAETYAEKWHEMAEHWGEEWSNFTTRIADGTESGGMYSSYATTDRAVINSGYYVNGYILHLRYDSAAQATDAPRMLEGPAVEIPEALQAAAAGEDFAQALQAAAGQFAAQHPQLPLTDGFLTLVSIDGPYIEAPDALLQTFYDAHDLERFVAVLSSGLASAETTDALMQQSIQDGSVAFAAMLAQGAPPSDTVSEALADSLNPALVSILSGSLTPAQAQRVAAAAYEQNNIAAFTVLMGSLTETDLDAFREMAHKDARFDFYAVLGGK